MNDTGDIAEEVNRLKTSIQVAWTKIRTLRQEARHSATLKERLRGHTAKSCQGVGDAFSLLQKLDYALSTEPPTSSHGQLLDV